MASTVIFLSILVAVLPVALASDQTPLQDFCVANLSGPVLVNSFTCKDAKTVQADDFFVWGFHLTGSTSNSAGSRVTPVSVNQLPGLNTLGISMVRIDFDQGGINPLHTHPRASEMLTVLEGSLEVGFITSSPEYRLITKVLEVGDVVFVFPEGLIHFQRNAGLGKAVAIGALSSKNPGVIAIGNAIFGSKPDIAIDLLSNTFQLDKNVVYHAQLRF